MTGHTPWREIRRSGPGSEERVAEHRRAMVMVMKLYELRRARGKTQTALAAEIGISRNASSKIENWGNPEIETATRLYQSAWRRTRGPGRVPDQEPVTFTTVERN